MTVTDILILLRDTSGSNDKVSILQTYSCNSTLRRVVQTALEPRYRFYATDIEIPTRFFSPAPYTLDQALDLADTMRGGTRGPSLKRAYEALLQQVSEEDAYALWCVLNKNLKCGVQAKTANKVWPGLVYIHPYMGAKPDNKKNREALKIEDGAYAEVKADGMYFDSVVDPFGCVSFYTRQGIPLTLHDTTLAKEYSKLPEGVYQGEGLILGDTGWLNRDVGNGIIRQAIDADIPKLYKDRLFHVLWDVVPRRAWNERVCKSPRHERLRSLYRRGVEKSTRIRIIDHKLVSSWEEAQEFYSSVLLAGGEGAIVKRADGTWKSTKPAWQVKMKVEAECDLLITGWKEDTQNPGLIGSFIVESACGGLVTAAAGLSNKQKRTPPEYFIGKVGRIKFNDISSTGTALTHPRVAGEKFLRGEGCEAHTVEEIKEIFRDAIGG